MIDVLVRAAIDAADENVRPRLRRCLPMLLAAVADWGGSPVGDITLACATPRHAMVLHADGDWPELDEAKFQKGDVALALVGAIESHKADGIIAVLLMTGPVTADTIGALLDAEQDSGVAPF